MPAEIGVVKCAALKSGNDLITAGNRFVDEMARYCALQSCIFDQGYIDALGCECVTEHLLPITDTWDEIRSIQETAPADEKERWVRAGCEKNDDELWVSTDRRTVLPRFFVVLHGGISTCPYAYWEGWHGTNLLEVMVQQQTLCSCRKAVSQMCYMPTDQCREENYIDQISRTPAIKGTVHQG